MTAALNGLDPGMASTIGRPSQAPPRARHGAAGGSAARALPGISIIAAMTDERLLGTHFAGGSWSTWRAVLKAAEGLPLGRAELAAFRAVAEKLSLREVPAAAELEVAP